MVLSLNCHPECTKTNLCVLLTRTVLLLLLGSFWTLPPFIYDLIGFSFSSLNKVKVARKSLDCSWINFRYTVLSLFPAMSQVFRRLRTPLPEHIFSKKSPRVFELHHVLLHIFTVLFTKPALCGDICLHFNSWQHLSMNNV